MSEHEELRRLWRDLAEKGIEHGVDWPRIVVTLFRDLDQRKAERDALAEQVARLLAGAGPSDPQDCPAAHGNQCCGYPALCRAALRPVPTEAEGSEG